MLMFLEGYTPPRQDAACALSPAQARLQEQVAAILNPEQLFNLNKRAGPVPGPAKPDQSAFPV